MSALNPLLSSAELTDFPAIRAEHIEPAIRELLASQREHIATLAANDAPSFATVVEPLEEMQHQLTRTWSPISHLNAVTNNDALRASYNQCLPLLSEYSTDLAQSEPLYRAYAAIAKREADSLDATQRRVIENSLRDFELAGVALPADRKERFKAVMTELSQLGAKFEENVLDATNAWKKHIADIAEL